MKLSGIVKKRLQSKVVWTSILAQVLLVFMLVDPHIADVIKIIGGVLIEVATLFGLLNNPSDTDAF